MIPFSREGSAVVGGFEPGEVELISTLATQIAGMLGELGASNEDDPLPGLVIGGSSERPADAALARLLPDAYGEAEASASAEFRRLTERGLAGRKVANAELLATSVATSVTLSEFEAFAWMRSITDIRLTLAARLGIEDDDSEVEQTDESDALLGVYDWLAGVQDSLVTALDS